MGWPDLRFLAARRKSAGRLISLETLIELKVASGMTAPHRLKDLADAIELIRVNALPAEYERRLHPYVRGRFAERTDMRPDVTGRPVRTLA